MEVVGKVFTGGIIGKSISCCSSFLLSIDTIDFRYFASFHRVRFSVQLSMFCFYPKTKCLYCTIHATVLYHTCCVRIFSVSGFAVFYSVIFRLFGIVLKHWNICYHLCICLPCFRISFPCIFYLFSIVFVYVICSLKFSSISFILLHYVCTLFVYSSFSLFLRFRSLFFSLHSFHRFSFFFILFSLHPSCICVCLLFSSPRC